MVPCCLVMSLFGIARDVTDGIGESENWKYTIIYWLVANGSVTMNLELKKVIQTLAT